MTVVAAIPARLGSKRLPNKPLLNKTDKPLIVHAVEQAEEASAIDAVVVVTDAVEIADVCASHGTMVIQFDSDAWCGTVRIAEAIEKEMLGGDIIVNIQCGEPLIEPKTLDDLVELTKNLDDKQVSTIVAPLSSVADFANKNITKADVTYANECYTFGRAGWFARAYQHVGVYGFKKKTLMQVGKLPQSRSSKVQSLEQLTWLDFDYRIKALEIAKAPLSINVQEDYDKFVELMA
jgi:3-deoxy-manno-octulosonate cytidylyltransferase (CMP-KDO synthetase)